MTPPLCHCTTVIEHTMCAQCAAFPALLPFPSAALTLSSVPMAKPASSKPPKASQDATQAKTPGKAAKGKSAGAGSKAKWSRENERDLIKFLVKIKSTAGDGASFKLPAFRAASQPRGWRSLKS